MEPVGIVGVGVSLQPISSVLLQGQGKEGSSLTSVDGLVNRDLHRGPYYHTSIGLTSTKGRISRLGGTWPTTTSDGTSIASITFSGRLTQVTGLITELVSGTSGAITRGVAGKGSVSQPAEGPRGVINPLAAISLRGTVGTSTGATT